MYVSNVAELVAIDTSSFDCGQCLPVTMLYYPPLTTGKMLIITFYYHHYKIYALVKFEAYLIIILKEFMSTSFHTQLSSI